MLIFKLFEADTYHFFFYSTLIPGLTSIEVQVKNQGYYFRILMIFQLLETIVRKNITLKMLNCGTVHVGKLLMVSFKPLN